jgi:hypothetical protein
MKTVKVAILDEATRLPTGETEEVVMSDAVENLVNQGLIVGDDAGIFFQRQLEYIQAQSYDVLYPELMAREVFALNTEGGEGINQITYRSYDKRGETAIIAGKATDLPRGDIDGKEYTIDVRTLGNAYGYSRQELAASRLTGMPLEQRKAEATRRSYEEKVNQLAWFGDATHNIHGLFGGPAGAPWSEVLRNVVPNAAANGNSPVWGIDKTPDEVIADLTSSCAKVYQDTKKIFRPNLILMSVEKKQYIMNTPRSTQSNVSILDWFITNNMFITSKDQIVDVNELSGIYAANGSATFDPEGGAAEGMTIMAASVDNMRLREPFPYVHLPVQYKGLEFEINCYGRFAGLELIRPGAIQHFHNI